MSVYESFLFACEAEGIKPQHVMYGLRRTECGCHRRNAKDVKDRHRVWRRMREGPNPPSLIRMAGLFGVSHSTIHAALKLPKRLDGWRIFENRGAA